MNRRAFLQTAGGVTALAAAQTMPSQTPPAGKPPRLGFDTYSLRSFGWKDFQLLDYAAGLKLDAIQFSSLEDFTSLEPEHLRKVRERAAQLGIFIDGGTGCICSVSKAFNQREASSEEALRKGLRASNLIGAKAMRCFMGAGIDRNDPAHLEACMAETIRACRAVRSEALDLNVKIAIENHSGDMQAREVRTIIEAAGKEYVASCLDSGNPMWVVEDPLVTMEVLGPYCVTMHTRDSVVFEHARGASAQWVALGDGVIDFPRFLEMKSHLCPDAPLHLEVITGRPPQVLPYYEADFWKRFPHALASEFARFVSLAKRGHPLMSSMVIEDAPGPQPPEFAAALREQQRVDLEKSLEFAKKHLGAGIQWRG